MSFLMIKGKQITIILTTFEGEAVKVLEILILGSFSDLFELFGDDIFGGVKTLGRRSSNRGRFRYDLTISEEVYYGQIKVLIILLLKAALDVQEPDRAGSKPIKCGSCNGHGKVRTSQGFFTIQQTCPDCSGYGETIGNPCKDCRGAGKNESRKCFS